LLPAQLDFSFEEKASERRIWPVHELVNRVGAQLERDYIDVWVEGEVSNHRAAPSGHVYFTLKDAEAQLPVVLFRRQASLLRFRPEDGLHVVVRGRLSIYQQRGQLQLVAELLEPVGLGSLQLAFEQLKLRLRAEGLFNSDQKKALPAFPKTVGVITSPTGAVIRDFLNIVSRRHSGLNVLLVPASVQGEGAAAEIESAIETLNRNSGVDVIVVARGGGSLEDLAAFNSERVARAIFASTLPIVSAVGHETDFTISDFVADLRAPTPSAAAELITEAQHRVFEFVTNLAFRAERASRYHLLVARQRLESSRAESAEWRMRGILQRLDQRLDDSAARIAVDLGGKLRRASQHVARLESAVRHHDPRRQLAQVKLDLRSLDARLERAVERGLRTSSADCRSMLARLHALSPKAVLDRGYALVQAQDGTFVRSVANIAGGDRLTTHLSDGTFQSIVNKSKSRMTKGRSAQAEGE